MFGLLTCSSSQSERDELVRGPQHSRDCALLHSMAQSVHRPGTAARVPACRLKLDNELGKILS